ncbi:MAG: universal stress protein [Chloroflexota bacterium]
MFDRILVCLDGSDLAEQVLPYVTEQASRFHSTVVLLEVVRPSSSFVTPVAPGAGPAAPVFTQEDANRVLREEQEAESYLARIAQRLGERGLGVEWVTRYGDPGTGVVTYAAEGNVDLIALATHGRGGLGRLVFGSVADHVLRQSGLPILLIRPREGSQPEQAPAQD